MNWKATNSEQLMASDRLKINDGTKNTQHKNGRYNDGKRNEKRKQKKTRFVHRKCPTKERTAQKRRGKRE